MTLQNRRFFSFLTLPCMFDTQSKKKWAALPQMEEFFRDHGCPSRGVPRLGQWHPYYSRCSALFFWVSAWPAFFVSEDSIAFATDFCNTPPPKVGCMDLFCILDTSSDDLGRHSGREMRHNLNVWAQGLGRGPSSCVFWFTNPSNYSYIHHISQLLHVIEVGNQLIYSLGAPHCPRSFLQIPSTRMNPSNNYELSDYNIIQPITTPMATIHRWIWWSHQYPSISKVFTIVEIPTVDGRNPASPWMVTGKKYLSTGAGFLPSTVLLTAKEFFSNTPISYQIPQFSLWSIARCHTMLNYQYTHLCHSISCVSHYQSNKMSTWVPGKFPIIGDWIAIFHHKIEVLPPRGMIPSIIILSSWYYGMI